MPSALCSPWLWALLMPRCSSFRSFSLVTCEGQSLYELYWGWEAPPLFLLKSIDLLPCDKKDAGAPPALFLEMNLWLCICYLVLCLRASMICWEILATSILAGFALEFLVVLLPALGSVAGSKGWGMLNIPLPSSRALL